MFAAAIAPVVALAARVAVTDLPPNDNVNESYVVR